MKTKKHIYSSILFIILGVFTASVNTIAYGNSGGSGGSGPGCYGCECFGTCEETTSGTSTTDGDKQQLVCLPKNFKTIPKAFGGICLGGSFIYTKSYEIVVGSFIKSYFEGFCINSLQSVKCRYRLDPDKCAQDTFVCPGGQILTRQGAQCTFPACPQNPPPGCPSDQFICPDGTKLNREGELCLFPLCQRTPDCADDQFTCPDGTKLNRGGLECSFPTCPEVIICADDQFTCPDGTKLNRVGPRCTFSSCPAINVINNLYSVGGTTKSGDIKIEGITVQIYNVFDKNFSSPLKGTQTSQNGEYIFDNVKPGEYVVKATSTELYIFLSSHTIKIEDSHIRNLNFNALTRNDVGDNDDTINEIIQTGLTSGTSDTSISEWIDTITGGSTGQNGNTTPGTGDNGEPLNEGDTEILSNFIDNTPDKFSGNSFISLLEKGYTLENKSYSPLPLSIIHKLANENAICGNKVIEDGETCDDGRNNGKKNYCSSDCLYIGEMRYSDEIVIDEEEYERGKMSIMSSIIESGKYSIDMITSEKAKEILKKTALIAGYGIGIIACIFIIVLAGLNVLIFKAHWNTYTVLSGDTFEKIGSKFTMTEGSIRRKNNIRQNKNLRVGMKIKVRNRIFLEKDYLEQLKSVLVDSLKLKTHTHFSEKIERIFAKK